MLISCEDGAYIEDRCPEYAHHLLHVMKNTTHVVKDIRDVKQPILKISLWSMYGEPEDTEQCLRHLQKEFGAEIKVVTSGFNWIDFIAPGCNKATALTILLEELQVKPEECIAFGDQYNDIEMLQLVGTAYAMSDAPPGVAEHADFLTDSVEDVLEEILHSLRESH